MIILLPVGILLLASLVIVILQQYKVGVGYSWFLAVGASLVSWGIILFLHWYPPLPFTLQSKGLGDNFNILLAFQLDLFSFPYAFGLVTLGLVVILTDLARIQIDVRNPWSWAAILAITGTGLLAIYAISPLTIVIAWTIIDLIEMVFIARSLEDDRLIRENVIAFSARVAGTMMIVFASFYSRSLGQELDLSSVLPSVGTFLLLASGLRLGVIPLHLPYRETGLRRGLGTMIRLVAPASSLVILGRLPINAILPELGFWLQILLTITVLYSSLMWLTAENEISGRPFWIITLSAYTIACAVRSQPAASIGWGVGLLLSGAVLFLYSARKSPLLFIPLLGLFGISGLPFTPIASSWQGLIIPQFNLFSLAFIFSQILLVLGYLKHALKPGESYESLTRWAQILYPLGLILLVLAEWFIGVFGWPGSFTIGSWVTSIITYILITLIFMGYIRFHHRFSFINQPQTARFGQVVIRVLANILSLKWVVRIILFIYKIMQNLIKSLTTLLEGEGGILWALLLLALVISLIQTGGGYK